MSVFGPLTWILVALSLVAMVYAVVLAARNKRIDWTVLAMLGVVEVGLIVQLIVGIVQFTGTDRDVSGPFFIGYLIGSLCCRSCCRSARSGRWRRAADGVPVRWPLPAW